MTQLTPVQSPAIAHGFLRFCLTATSAVTRARCPRTAFASVLSRSKRPSNAALAVPFSLPRPAIPGSCPSPQSPFCFRPAARNPGPHTPVTPKLAACETPKQKFHNTARCPDTASASLPIVQAGKAQRISTALAKSTSACLTESLRHRQLAWQHRGLPHPRPSDDWGFACHNRGSG